MRQVAFSVLACVLVGCGAPDPNADASSAAKQSCAATYSCHSKFGTVEVDTKDQDDACYISQLSLSYKKDGTVIANGSVLPNFHWSGTHKAFSIQGTDGEYGEIDVECTWLHDAPPPEPTVTCVEYYTYDNICSSTTGSHHESMRCDDNVPQSDCKSRNNDNVNEYCSTFMSWRDDAFTGKSCADLGYENGVSKDL